MIYKINGNYLDVKNEIKEFENLIFGRFSQFEIADKKTKNILFFKKESVEICINGNYKVLNHKIVRTDIYPIICNVIAYFINDDKNIFMHSVVVSKDNNGTLIVGNFGQGKTTLAKTFEKNGYEVNSTDQTWLQIKDNALYQILGSRFGLKKENVELLENEKARRNVKIQRIIRIVGLCDKGETSCNYNYNVYHRVKNLSGFCNWHYTMPIFTDDIELYNTNILVKTFLKNLSEIKIEYIDIRGDKIKILNELGVVEK